MLTVDYYYIPFSEISFLAGIFIALVGGWVILRQAKHKSALAVYILGTLMAVFSVLPYSFLLDREEPLISRAGVVQEVDGRNFATLESGELVALVEGARAGEQVDVLCLEAESICIQDGGNIKEMNKAFNAALTEKAASKLSINYRASISEKSQTAR